MDWSDPEQRLALARLLEDGKLMRNRRTAPVLDFLLELGWVNQTPRRNEIALAETRRQAVENLLDNYWPQWRASVAALHAAGLELSDKNLTLLQRSQTLEARTSLPRRLHRKTFAAIVAEHSKSAISDELRESYPDLSLTVDDVLRLRCNRGLVLQWGKKPALDSDLLMETLGEVVIPERAFQRGLALAGNLPKIVLLVENLGAFVDLPLPEPMLAIHEPGWNSFLALKFIARLPQNMPIYHFGDLDPNGLAIFAHLRKTSGRDIRLFAPEFWFEYLESHGRILRENGWQAESFYGIDRGLIRRLAASGRWLEQEVILVDPRLASALANLITYNLQPVGRLD